MAQTYAVHVVSHSKHNRTARAELPKNPRKRQHIGPAQTRVVRGRPLILTEEQFQAYLPELREKARTHAIDVRTSEGRWVNLDTLEVSAAPPPVPQANPPMDSLANDKNPKYPPGWKFVPPYVSDDQTVPQVVKPGEKPQLFKSEEKSAEKSDTVPPPPGDETALDAAIDAAQKDASDEEGGEGGEEFDHTKG